MQLTLTTLNISKSAYVSYSFAANRFFSRYNFEGSPLHRDRFFCQLYTRVCFLQAAQNPLFLFLTSFACSLSLPSSGPVKGPGINLGRRTLQSSGAMSPLTTALARRAAWWLGSPSGMVRYFCLVTNCCSLAPGITASHSLPYEVKPPIHAKFNKDEAGNHWAISSRTLRQLMDHFGPGIELLDINTDDEARVVNFTCFTEKVQKRGTVNNEGSKTAGLD